MYKESEVDSSVLVVGTENKPFKDLPLAKDIQKRLKKLGFDEAFPIQAATIPYLLSHTTGDVCSCAPTGSGKTLAYVLPIVNTLLGRVVPRLRALIILPTRDLVLQVKSVFDDMLKKTDLVVEIGVGQSDFAEEQKKLVEVLPTGEVIHKADIFIATPGRLIDHLNQTKGFSMQYLRYLVIDEADRLLAQSYNDWVNRVLDACETTPQPSLSQRTDGAWSLTMGRTCTDPLDPRSSPMQKLLFSATLPKNPQKIAALRLHCPVYFSYTDTGKFVTPESLKSHCVFRSLPLLVTPYLPSFMVVCELRDKPLILMHLLKTQGLKRALCFAASVEETHRLYRLLELVGGIRVAEYSSTLPPAVRSNVLDSFRNGQIDLIICSDAAARGLDIEEVDVVINYDVPVYIRTFIHRVGRTARAGREGQTFTLLRKEEVHHFKELLKKTEGAKVKQIPVKGDELTPHKSTFQTALTRLKSVLEKERSGQQSAIHALATLGASAHEIETSLSAKYADEEPSDSMDYAGIGSKRKDRDDSEVADGFGESSKRADRWTEAQKIMRAQILSNLEGQRKK